MSSDPHYVKVEDTIESEDSEQSLRWNPPQQLILFGDSSLSYTAFKLFVAGSLIFNTLFISHFVHLWGKQDAIYEIPPQTQYSGLKTDIRTPFPMIEKTYVSLHDTVWNGPEMDEVLGVVALDLDFIKDKNLPSSLNYPWDNNKRVYTVTYYHTLHCLRFLRQSVLESSTDRKQSIPLEHLTHCLNILLDDTMCHADDTPRSMDHTVKESRLCRDYRGLSEWSLENTACWSHPDGPNALFEEQFKNCPNGSVFE